MSWQGWGHFWSMGGYALYVWGSYAVTFALIAAEVALVVKRKRSVLRMLRSSAGHQEARRT